MAKKPDQPDADNDKQKKLEGHDDEQEQETEDDESEGEGSGDEGGADDDETSESDDEDMSQWSPEKVKGYVKGLRKENAKYRKEAKTTKSELADFRKQITGMQTAVAKALGLKEGEELTPEEQAEALSGQLGAQQFKTAVLEAAYQYEVPRDSRDYFEYLVQKQASELEEGEELTDEDIEMLAKKAKGKSGKAGFSTSITKGAGRRRDEEADEDEDSDESDAPPPSKGGSKLTAEQFAEMGTVAKTNLYSKNPGLYDKLMAEARRKNLLKTI